MNKEQFKVSFSDQMKFNDTSARMLLLEKDMFNRDCVNYFAAKSQFVCSEFGLHIVVTRKVIDGATVFDISYTDVDAMTLQNLIRCETLDLSDPHAFDKGLLLEMLRMDGHKLIFELSPLRIVADNYQYFEKSEPAIMQIVYNIDEMKFEGSFVDVLMHAWKSLRTGRAPAHYIDFMLMNTLRDVIQNIEQIKMPTGNKEFLLKALKNNVINDNLSTLMQIIKKLKGMTK